MNLFTKLVVSLSLVSCSVSAATLSETFPEVNFASFAYPNGPHEVGTALFVIAPGEVIVSAVLSGIFGATSEFIGSTAHHRLFIDGEQVADTNNFDPSPFESVVQFSVVVPISVLLDGSATLSFIQDTESVVRLSETTLEITTRTVSTTVPDGGNTLVILGSVFSGLGILIRRKV